MRKACEVVTAVIARMAFNLLANDEDDLYYDKGQHTSQLLRDLVGACQQQGRQYRCLLFPPSIELKLLSSLILTALVQTLC